VYRSFSVLINRPVSIGSVFREMGNDSKLLTLLKYIIYRVEGQQCSLTLSVNLPLETNPIFNCQNNLLILCATCNSRSKVTGSAVYVIMTLTTDTRSRVIGELPYLIRSGTAS